MLGSGSYGRVLATSKVECRKEFTDMLAPTVFRQVMLFRTLAREEINVTECGILCPLQLIYNDQRRIFSFVFPRFCTDLHNYVCLHGPVVNEAFATLHRNLRQGLDFLHHHLHFASLDVSPSNVLLQPDGHAVITDFDLARHVSWTSLAVDIAYCLQLRPPEIFLLQKHLKPEELMACDIWALGMTLDFANRGKYVIKSDIDPLQQILSWWGPAPIEWAQYPGSYPANVEPVYLQEPPDWQVYKSCLHLAPLKRSLFATTTTTEIITTTTTETTTTTITSTQETSVLKRLQQHMERLSFFLQEADAMDVRMRHVNIITQRGKYINNGIVLNSIVLLDMVLYSRPYDVHNYMLSLACLHLACTQFDDNGINWQHEIYVTQRQQFCTLIIELAELCSWEPILGITSVTCITAEMLHAVTTKPIDGYHLLKVLLDCVQAM